MFLQADRTWIGKTPRQIVKAWENAGPGVAIPSGLIDLVRIDSARADEPIAPGAGAFTAIWADIWALQEQAHRLTAAGWVPHPLLPIADLVGPEKSPTNLDHAVSTHVEQHASEIYNALLARLDSYADLGGACLVARDAISAHKAGYYAVVVPAIFPEIERCSRVALGLGSGIKTDKVLKRLLTKIKGLPVGDLDPFLATEAIDLMSHYMYESVGRDIDLAAKTSMPHRHVSQHGLGLYSKPRDGLNAVFILDFVLNACTTILRETPAK